MIRINLLPHREEKRKARRQQFFVLAALVIAAGAALAFLVHGIISGYIGSQEEKNAFLKQEIAKLDKEIEEIKRLKEQTEALLSRKQVIESLQANRAEAVMLFNELARQVPEGIYLKSLKQTGQRVSLTRYAQSNARVSTLMRNLDASPLLERPELVEIQAATVNNRRLNQFNLNVYISRGTGEGGGQAGAKPSAQANPVSKKDANA